MALLKFLGAAQEVTGSCHLLESPACGRILLDCGMHQGGDAVDRLQREEFPFDPAQIDAVILSHAHLDHSGLLPKLAHEHFRGPIYCTEATAELLEVMLHDSAGIYQRDLERENLRLARKGKSPIKPQYVRNDVLKVLKLCQPQPYNRAFPVSDQAQVTFHDAGHILGSAIVEIALQEMQQTKTLVFSGDLGKKGTVLMNDPAHLTQADIVLMEGTYGDREHRTLDNTVDQLRDILRDAWDKGGNVLIPAFSVGRTQELLFYLGLLHQEGVLNNWQVFLDSPMAISVTRIYDRWLDTLDCEGVKPLCNGDRTLLGNFLPKLRLSVTPEDSMAINNVDRGAIIIAGSGMCTGGRIRHHIKQRVWNKRNYIIFVGFQARGTLGRILVDGVRHIKLFGEDYIVKARIETLGGFSAHAGQRELVEWISRFNSDPQVQLIHGEPEALETLSQLLWREKGISAGIPSRGRSHAF